MVYKPSVHNIHPQNVQLVRGRQDSITYCLLVNHVLISLLASPSRLTLVQQHLLASARAPPVNFSDWVSDDGLGTFVVGGDKLGRAVACCMLLRAASDVWESCS